MHGPRMVHASTHFFITELKHNLLKLKGINFFSCFGAQDASTDEHKGRETPASTKEHHSQSKFSTLKKGKTKMLLNLEILTKVILFSLAGLFITIFLFNL
jgi:hypothetical protein